MILAVVIISLVVAGSAVIVIGILIMLSPLLQVFFPKFINLPVNGVIGAFLMIVGGIFITVMGTFFVIVLAYSAKKLYKVVIKLLKRNLKDINEKTEVFK